MSLLNRSAVKTYILLNVKAKRAGWDCQRVSKEYLDNLEARVRAMVNTDIHQHRSVGKTFKP